MLYFLKPKLLNSKVPYCNTNLKDGEGFDCAKHVRAIADCFFSVIEDDSSFELNFGLVVPTGSKNFTNLF